MTYKAHKMNEELEKESGKEESVEVHSKLTDWKNEPTILDLKEDLTNAQSDHSHQVSKIDRWLDNLFVRGSARVPKVNGRSSVVPKLIRKQCEWRYAALSEPFLSTEDLFKVDPVTWEDKKAAEQNELVLNHQFNTRINKVNLVAAAVRTAVNEGTIIFKLGWEFEEEEYTELEDLYDYVEDTSEENMAFLQQLVEIYEQDPHSFSLDYEPHIVETLMLSMETGIPVRADYVETVEVPKTRTIKNHPSVEVCDYRTVIIDPTCKGDIQKASFVIHAFETTLSELKKDGKYKNLDKINVSTASPLSEPDIMTGQTKSFQFKDKPRSKLVAYEYWGYWDIDGSGIVKPIVATFVGNVVIRMEENPFPDKKIPFVTTAYLPVKDSIYGESDAELLEDNQKIAGAVMRGMIDLMARSANSQIGISKDALDVTNRRKFMNGEDYEFNPQVDPRRGMFQHQYPEIPASAYNLLSLQNQEAEAITGVKAFHGGITGQALGNTATGVRSALDATAKRDLDILRRIAKGFEEVGRKIIAMNSEFLDEEEVIRITNEDFVKVRRDDLFGKFDLKLSISTAESDNQKAEELAYMLQTLGNSVDFGITKLILRDIARLRKMPMLAKEIERYEPQPDPIEEELRMLEVEKVKAEIAKLYADAQKRGSEAEMGQHKAMTEMAKQAKLQAETDRTNLDFVEEESGVKQERNLQLARAQGETNMKLEVLKKLLEAQTPRV